MNLPKSFETCSFCSKREICFVLDCFCLSCSKCAQKITLRHLRKLQSQKQISTCKNFQSLGNPKRSMNQSSKEIENELPYRTFGRGGNSLPQDLSQLKKNSLACKKNSNILKFQSPDHQQKMKGKETFLESPLNQNNIFSEDKREIVFEISKNRSKLSPDEKTCKKCGNKTEHKMKNISGMDSSQKLDFICNSFIVNNYMETKEMLKESVQLEVTDLRDKLGRTHSSLKESQKKTDFLSKILRNLIEKKKVKMTQIDPEILIQDNFGIIGEFFNLHSSNIQDSTFLEELSPRFDPDKDKNTDLSTGEKDSHLEDLDIRLSNNDSYVQNEEDPPISRKILSQISENMEESNLFRSIISQKRNSLKLHTPSKENSNEKLFQKEFIESSKKMFYKLNNESLSKQRKNQMDSEENCKNYYFSNQKRDPMSIEKSPRRYAYVVNSKERIGPKSPQRRVLRTLNQNMENSLESFEKDYFEYSSKRKKTKSALFPDFDSGAKYTPPRRIDHQNGPKWVAKNTQNQYVVNPFKPNYHQVIMNADYFESQKENINPNGMNVTKRHHRSKTLSTPDFNVEAKLNLLSTSNNERSLSPSNNITNLTINNTKSTIGIKKSAKNIFSNNPQRNHDASPRSPIFHCRIQSSGESELKGQVGKSFPKLNFLPESSQKKFVNPFDDASDMSGEVCSYVKRVRPENGLKGFSKEAAIDNGEFKENEVQSDFGDFYVEEMSVKMNKQKKVRMSLGGRNDVVRNHNRRMKNRFY